MTAIWMPSTSREFCRIGRCSHCPTQCRETRPTVSQIVVSGSPFGAAERSASLECHLSAILAGACGQSDLSCAAIANHLDHSCAKCALPTDGRHHRFADVICEQLRAIASSESSVLRRRAYAVKAPAHGLLRANKPPRRSRQISSISSDDGLSCRRLLQETSPEFSR